MKLTFLFLELASQTLSIKTHKDVRTIFKGPILYEIPLHQCFKIFTCVDISLTFSCST